MLGTPFPAGQRTRRRAQVVRPQAVLLPTLSLHGSFLAIFAAAVVLFSGLSPSRAGLSNAAAQSLGHRLSFAVAGVLPRFLSPDSSGPSLAVSIVADGHARPLRLTVDAQGAAPTVGDALRAAGVPFSPRDRLSLNGTPVSAETG